MQNKLESWSSEPVSRFCIIFHGPVFVALKCVRNVMKNPLQFCLTKIKTRGAPTEIYRPKKYQQRQQKNQAKPLIVRGFLLFGLPSNENSCQVLKTTRNCIEVDVFSPNLKQINTRKIRIHPNIKELSKSKHVWNHHKKTLGIKILYQFIIIIYLDISDINTNYYWPNGWKDCIPQMVFCFMVIHYGRK